MIKMKKTLLFSLVILFSLSFYSVYALEASTESYFESDLNQSISDSNSFNLFNWILIIILIIAIIIWFYIIFIKKANKNKKSKKR